MDDKLEFLSGEPAQVEEPRAEEAAIDAGETPALQAAETPPESPPERPNERVRGPDGKFAAKEPPEPGHVPLSAMLDEREKRQAAERQLAEIRAKAPPPEPPSLEAQVEARLYAQNLRTSRRFAESQYGAEAVAEVHDWAAARCDADPMFNQQMRASDHPYEDAMKAFQRDRIVAEVSPADLDAFRAWKQAQASPPTATQAPPRSLADASGTGSMGKPPAIPVHEGAAFAALPFN